MKWNENASSWIWVDLILVDSPMKFYRAVPRAEVLEWEASVDIFTVLRHLHSWQHSSHKWLFAIMHKSNTISLSTDGASEIDGEPLHQSNALWF